MRLDSGNIDRVVRDCLFRDHEVTDRTKIPEDAVIVKGIVTDFGFKRERLESHRAEVREMLSELPDSFMKGKGGGMSFLAACYTKDGEQWGEHPDMEALFCLGLGLGLVESLMPRDTWQALPGGMPYYVVNL
jgi:hypothetical protein